MLPSFLASSRADLRGEFRGFVLFLSTYYKPLSREYRPNLCRAHVDLASVEVRFQNLSVSAEVAVGARGEPTVLNAYRNQFEVKYLGQPLVF